MTDIECARCGRTAAPPTDVTWGGALGDAIRTRVCAACYAEWESLSVRLVNEYRLSMANREHYALFVTQMKSFLGLEKSPSGGE
jgi:Fe-S cluster biosynthesis and repair protein YggX